MSDQVEQPGEGPPAKRGEAAWKEAREGVAQRNAQARKADLQRKRGKR